MTLRHHSFLASHCQIGICATTSCCSCATMMMQYKRPRSAAIGLLTIAILATLCLNKLVNYMIPIDDDAQYLQVLNHQNQKRNLLIDNDLLTALHTNCNYNNINATVEDYTLEAANAANITNEIVRDQQDAKSSSSSSSSHQTTIQNYTLSDTLQESTIYEHTFCLLLYDPPTNKFLILSVALPLALR